jgi:glycosyltransferase involved in cell wall biosynthesis
MESDKPLVSICIPVYEMHGKGVPFLRDLLTSVKKQLYKNIEVVISDHSVNDEIEKWIGGARRELYEKGIKLLYFKFELRRGNSSANMNNAIKHATGDIIKPIFQDDYFCDLEVIGDIVEEFEKDKSKHWGMTPFIHTDETLSKYYGDQNPRYNRTILIGNNTLGCPSCLFFKKDSPPVQFDENLIWLMDCELYHNLFTRYGKPIIMKNIRVAIRVWSQSVSKEVSDVIKKVEEIYVLKKYNETLESLESHE